jgi:hypothetical protein
MTEFWVVVFGVLWLLTVGLVFAQRGTIEKLKRERDDWRDQLRFEQMQWRQHEWEEANKWGD